LTVNTDWEDEEVDFDSSRPSEVVGTITQTSQRTGLVNNQVFYDLDQCEHGNFIPCKGDWVKVALTYSGENGIDVTAVKIQPLRQKGKHNILQLLFLNHLWKLV